MENVNKLAILLNVIQNKTCVFVPMNLVRDFSDLCKNEGIQTEAEIYLDKMLFTLVK